MLRYGILSSTKRQWCHNDVGSYHLKRAILLIHIHVPMQVCWVISQSKTFTSRLYEVDNQLIFCLSHKQNARHYTEIEMEGPYYRIVCKAIFTAMKRSYTRQGNARRGWLGARMLDGTPWSPGNFLHFFYSVSLNPISVYGIAIFPS